MMPPKPARSRSAFAVITAIVLMGVLAALLAVMASQATSQIQRDHRAIDDAQLRQLLLAAEPTARQLLAPGSPRSIAVVLPPALEAACTCTREAEGVILVQAHIGARHRSQRLTYQQTPTGWQLRAALLDPA